MHPKRNLAHRMGRWSGLHPEDRDLRMDRLRSRLPSPSARSSARRRSTSRETGVGESGRAAKTLHDAGFEEPAGEMVLIQAREGELSSAEYHRRSSATSRTRSRPRAAVAPGRPEPQLSEDGRSALVSWDLTGDRADGVDKLPAMTADRRPGRGRRTPRSPSTRPAASRSSRPSTTSSPRTSRRPRSSPSRSP